MANDKNKSGQKENTKDMSSDVEKVKGQHQAPPPQSSGENNPNNTKDDSSDAEAQKGHA